MPVSSSVVSVGTSITEVSGPYISSKVVYLQDGDFSNASAVYVGGSDVTTSTGVKLSKVNVSVFQINGNDTLYAVGDAGTCAVRVTEVK